VRTLLFEDFAGSKKVQECGPLALGYAALLPHLQQQRLKGLNFDSMLRFEQRNLAQRAASRVVSASVLLWAQALWICACRRLTAAR
jgi:hypothetical protein